MTGKLYIPDLREAAANRPAGYIDEILGSGRIENDVVLHIDIEVYRALLQKYSPPSNPKAAGPGTELKKLLSKLGLKPAANCKCNQRIREMNQKGVEWCKANIPTIIGWLKEEAERAKLPFIEIGARIIIKRAIRNATK